MRLRLFLILLFSLVCTGLVAAQESAVVFEFDAIGLDDETAMAATNIFRTELEADGRFSVISKGEMEAKFADEGITDFSCHGVTCAVDYGQAIGADYAIIGSLTKLGDRITAEVRLVNVLKKAVVFSDNFFAASASDLDPVQRRLAKAVASRRKIETEVGRYDVTAEEAQEPRRKKSFITSGASFGFGFPLGDSYAGVSNLKTVAWTVRYEAGNYVIESYFGVTWGSGDPDTSYGFIIDETQVSVVPWDIGMRYVFNRENDLTPFVGGGIGLHFIAAQEVRGQVYAQSDEAMALHLAGGIYAFQSYDFRLAVEGKYTIVFSDAFGAESGSNSHQFGISIGISRKFEKTEKRGCMSGGCLF